MPLPQQYTLDTLLNELWQILRHSPRIFFWDNSSGELIMPMAHACSTCFHSLCIVEHATLNLIVMVMMEPLLRWSSVAVISNMEITSKCQLFDKSVWGGSQWDASESLSAQTSTPNFDTFFSPLFRVVTCKQMTIKHPMYTQKVSFLCTERACVVFSGFGIRHRRKVMWSKVLQVLQTRGSKLKGEVKG